MNPVSREEPRYITPPKEPELINKVLPVEIIQMIFSHLNNRDMKSTIATCRLWGANSVTVLINEDVSPLMDFAKMLINFLPKEKQKDALLNFGVDTTIRKNPYSRKEAIPFFFELNRQLLDILKEIPKTELPKLKELPVEISDQKMLTLVDLYMDKDKLNSDLAPPEREALLKSIALKLCSSDIRAVDFIKTFSDESQKAEVLQAISKYLADNGFFEAAKKTARTISIEEMKNQAFLYIARKIFDKKKLKPSFCNLF